MMHQRIKYIFIGSAGVLASIIVPSLLLYPRSRTPATNLAAWPLLVEPGIVEFGRITASAAPLLEIELANKTNHHIEIPIITTSCECLRTSPGTLDVSPGGRASLAVRFDASKEPNFVGALNMTINGWKEDGTLGFHAQATAEVVR